VTIQVVPLRRSIHPGCNGDFTILSYDGGGATVYNELLASSVMSNESNEVATYQQAMKSLTTDIALPVEESVRLLEELAS
jgi:hypothetical protein